MTFSEEKGKTPNGCDEQQDGQGEETENEEEKRNHKGPAAHSFNLFESKWNHGNLHIRDRTDSILPINMLQKLQQFGFGDISHLIVTAQFVTQKQTTD